MTLSYYLINPTGNITLLVKTPVPVDKMPQAASELMKLEPTAEQVGFINGTCLRMAGGEFCGNATLSAAGVYCLENGLEGASLNMTVSGAEDTVPVEISKTAENEYTGTVTMPSPLGLREITAAVSGKAENLTVVDFPGISHIISEGIFDMKEAEKAAPGLCKKLGADALGIMLVDEKASVLTPLVYVPAAGTMVRESSCASGTTAAGVYLSSKYGKEIDISFTEPGGALRVKAAKGRNPGFTGKAAVSPVREAEINI